MEHLSQTYAQKICQETVSSVQLQLVDASDPRGEGGGGHSVQGSQEGV